MSDNRDKESSGIVCGVSRRAGAVAGRSVVISKKIAGYSVKTVTAATDCFKKPFKLFVPAKDKSGSPVSGTPAPEETSRKGAAKALIAALESDLAAAKRDLENLRETTAAIPSEVALPTGELEAEKESLSDLEQAKREAAQGIARDDEVRARIGALESELSVAQRQGEMSGTEEGESVMEPTVDRVDQFVEEPQAKAEERPAPKAVEPEMPTPVAALESELSVDQRQEDVSGTEEVESVTEPTMDHMDQFVEEPQAKAEEQPALKAVDAEMTAPVAVMEEDVQAAIFSSATDKIIFSRALSDIAGQNASVRADAAKTIAGVRHELSVKALSAQMVSESSVTVRQECVKGLVALGMTEALPAVERALEDREGSVRLAAVWGLYQLAGQESGLALVRMLSDEDEEVRRRVATCIGWIGQEKLALDILPLLDDTSASVRKAAAEALGKLRNRQAVSTLIARLNDPSASVKKAVLIAIETITGKKLSESFPKDKKGYERLTARWDEWWKAELLG